MGHRAVLSPTLTAVRPPGRRRYGFTLVEALLALVVTSLIGGATVAMLSATAYGTTSRENMRSLLVKSRAVDTRLGAAVRSAVEIIPPGVATDHIVLWVADDNNDNAKQRNEMQLIVFDSGANELRTYRDTSDTQSFVAEATFKATAEASYTPQTWATGVSDLTFALTTAPAGSTLVSYRLTVGAGNDEHIAVGAHTTRQ